MEATSFSDSAGEVYLATILAPVMEQSQPPTETRGGDVDPTSQWEVGGMSVML